MARKVKRSCSLSGSFYNSDGLGGVAGRETGVQVRGGVGGNGGGWKPTVLSAC